MDILAIVYAVALLGGLGVIFGVVLTVADKKFAIKMDERAAKVRSCLPGANCGACGFAGCDAFAAAVIRSEAKVDGCTAGGARTAKAVAVIMGTQVQESDPSVARSLCQGECGVALERYDYSGLKSCQLAIKMSGGPKNCRFSCVGLGDCQRACKFDAIHMNNGIAQIDPEKCTACECCVKACPRNIIEMKPRKAKVVVLCRSKDTGKITRDSCSKGCIACKRCEKACKYDAIHVVDNCAAIDPDKCTLCEECVKVCPTNSIKVLN